MQNRKEFRGVTKFEASEQLPFQLAKIRLGVRDPYVGSYRYKTRSRVEGTSSCLSFCALSRVAGLSGFEELRGHGSRAIEALERYVDEEQHEPT